MKLRNKKTGEIIEFGKAWLADNDNTCMQVNSLTELNDEWEDCEDPKDHWHIGCEGDVFIDNTERCLKSYSSIGNDFETKEEAEKALEKLKAWKRLKDKGFMFIEGQLGNNDDFIIKAKMGWVGLIDRQDVGLLFGGKE